MSRKENAIEKSNFARRCSLLSRYLKEKGSFGNINLGLVRKPNSDRVLSGNSYPPVRQHKADSETKTLDVFQRVSKGESSSSSRGKANEYTNLSKSSEPGSSQLTIFFGGQVLVYNEFPTDKAKEIMEVAKQAKPVTDINIKTQINVENNNDNKSNMVNLPDLNEPINSVDIINQQNHVVERIARRASLHRFFAKRKDRSVARAPYQVNQNAGHHHDYPPKPETAHGQPLESGQSSKPPENAVAQTMSHPKPEGDNDFSMEIKEEGQCSKDLQLRL
ncbi:Protein TIFY 11A [Hirschfeldia incana]|nr:Protein TIFY 11A [Hirschfeldia incana]